MTFIKICGITNTDDALDCAELGADAVGFNFYSRSSRYIAPEAAAQIAAKLPDGIDRTGVFVNESAERVLEIAATAGLDSIQLHGDESPAYLSKLMAQTDLKIIKAVRMRPGFDPNELMQYRVDSVLLDAYSSTERGGTGCTLDWDVARACTSLTAQVYLAGGLSAENVVDAIATVRPFAVDACSRLESLPGRKDREKVARFIAAVRSKR